jgi:hypothetical protein
MGEFGLFFNIFNAGGNLMKASLSLRVVVVVNIFLLLFSNSKSPEAHDHPLHEHKHALTHTPCTLHAEITLVPTH